MRTIKYLFLVWLLASSIQYLFAQSVLFPCRQSGGYSYCNPNGKIAIVGLYDSALSFRGALAPVVLQGSWAYIDKLGRVRILTYISSWDSLPEFKNGILTVSYTHAIFGFITKYYNTGGNLVVLKNPDLQPSNANDTLEYSIFDPSAAIARARSQLGKKYGQDGLDCSGFMRFITHPFGLWLPYSAKEQLGYGMAISRTDAQAGDLILFGSGSVASHVGMIISEKNAPIVFIHSSTTKGVIQEKLDALAYWKTKVIGFRRLIY